MILKFSYIGITLLVVLFLIYIGFIAIDKTSHSPKKDKYLLVAGLLIWQIFILILGSTELLQSYSFPPRFALAFIIPSFVFTGVFLYKNRNKQWIKAIPEHWVVYFQSFRILVETIFVLSVAQGILNPQVTIEGYNYDMVFAFTAPIVAYLVYNKKALPYKTILYWNYLGLAVLATVIFVFLTSIYRPSLYGSEVPLLPLAALTYPYVLVAGFLMPTAVFLHFLSIIQIKRVES